MYQSIIYIYIDQVPNINADHKKIKNILFSRRATLEFIALGQNATYVRNYIKAAKKIYYILTHITNYRPTIKNKWHLIRIYRGHRQRLEASLMAGKINSILEQLENNTECFTDFALSQIIKMLNKMTTEYRFIMHEDESEDE